MLEPHLQSHQIKAHNQHINPHHVTHHINLSRQISTPPRRQAYSHSLGSIGINWLLYSFIPLLVFACLFSYYCSVKYKQQPPFPHATVTDTSCHYPQDIVFRYFMLASGGFIGLVYFTAFRWLSLLKKQSKYPGPIFLFLNPLGQVSVLGFYGAIATIDGAGLAPIHAPGAIFFFVLLFIIAVTLTIVMRDMHSWDTSIISRRSIQLKSALILYLFGNVIYFFVGMISQHFPHVGNGDEDIYAVIIEWNLTLVCMVWLITFSLDWGDIKITLKRETAQGNQGVNEM